MSTQRTKRIGKLAVKAQRRAGNAAMGQIGRANRLTRRTPLYPFQTPAYTPASLNIALSMFDTAEGDHLVTNYSVTGIPQYADGNGQLPTSVDASTPGEILLHYATAPASPLNIPFEDPAVRSPGGGYVVPGLITYTDSLARPSLLAEKIKTRMKGPANGKHRKAS